MVVGHTPQLPGGISAAAARRVWRVDTHPHPHDGRGGEGVRAESSAQWPLHRSGSDADFRYASDTTRSLTHTHTRHVPLFSLGASTRGCAPSSEGRSRCTRDGVAHPDDRLPSMPLRGCDRRVVCRARPSRSPARNDITLHHMTLHDMT